MTPYKANVTDNLSSDVASKLLQPLTFFRGLTILNGNDTQYTCLMLQITSDDYSCVTVFVLPGDQEMEGRGTNLSSQ